MKSVSGSKYWTGIVVLLMLMTLTACATVPKDRYNTQKGAAIGAGLGALLGQAIGRDTNGTLLGAGIGTMVGAIAGNAVDQNHEIARAAANSNDQAVYADSQGSAIAAAPYYNRQQNTNCRKVTKRAWNKGSLEQETVEETCDGEKISSDY